MTTLRIDTYEFVHGLTKAGIPENQAKAIADGFKNLDLQYVATKQDIAELEVKLLKWAIPLLLGQTAIFAVIVQWLTSA